MAAGNRVRENEVGEIRESLVRSQESQSLKSKSREGLGGAIVAVLQGHEQGTHRLAIVCHDTILDPARAKLTFCTNKNEYRGVRVRSVEVSVIDIVALLPLASVLRVVMVKDLGKPLVRCVAGLEASGRTKHTILVISTAEQGVSSWNACENDQNGHHSTNRTVHCRD